VHVPPHEHQPLPIIPFPQSLRLLCLQTPQTTLASDGLRNQYANRHRPSQKRQEGEDRCRHGGHRNRKVQTFHRPGHPLRRGDHQLRQNASLQGSRHHHQQNRTPRAARRPPLPPRRARLGRRRAHPGGVSPVRRVHHLRDHFEKEAAPHRRWVQLVGTCAGRGEVRSRVKRLRRRVGVGLVGAEVQLLFSLGGRVVHGAVGVPVEAGGRHAGHGDVRGAGRVLRPAGRVRKHVPSYRVGESHRSPRVRAVFQKVPIPRCRSGAEECIRGGGEADKGEHVSAGEAADRENRKAEKSRVGPTEDGRNGGVYCGDDVS
jgi:hypothetical protein